MMTYVVIAAVFDVALAVRLLSCHIRDKLALAGRIAPPTCLPPRRCQA